jgi:alpha-L-arabinofuranosidase
MKMMTANWAIAADTSPHTLVDAQSDHPLLAPYANLRPDGKLALLVVNKDPANGYRTAISVAGFTPGSTATTWTLDARNYAWQSTPALPHADPDVAPAALALTGLGSSFEYTFAPYSVTVLSMDPAP